MNLRLLPLLCLPFAAFAQNTGERATYTCDNGSRIEIAFSTAADGRPQAELHFADAAITLPQVPAASGALYRDETIRLHTRDDQALFEDKQGNTRHCLLGQSAPPTAAANNAPATPGSIVEITGNISYRKRNALPPDAELVIRVQDISRRGSPARQLAEQRIALDGQPGPIPFTTGIDRDLIGKKARITVSAHIEQAGRTLFASNKSYPAISQGLPVHQDIQLQQVNRGRPR